jgi:phospholipid/cholesterol/gamma-HCH transport system ATP-binding protein
MNPSAPNPPAPASAISVENLRCGYDGRTVLDKIDFTVPRGQIFYIVGGSGCGKSTLLKHMIGLHHPSAGRVSYFGEDFTHAPVARRREILQTFGVLYQSAALWSSLTLRENVSLPLEEYTTLAKRERDLVVAHKLAQVNLGGYEDYYPSEISGGMKKRAGLARALALDPQIIFLDEPSAGLDPVTSRNLDDLLLTIRDNLGATLVIVSHELGSIFGIAERILMLDREARGVIADGPPRQLAATSPDPRVRDFLQRDPAPQSAAIPIPRSPFHNPQPAIHISHP